MRFPKFGAALLATCALSAVVANGASAATKYEPPTGKIYSGVSTSGLANFDAFLGVSNQSSVAIYNRFSAKGLNDFAWILSEFKKRPVVGMISWWMHTDSYSTSTPGGTQQSIAKGDIDSYILARAAEVRSYGKPLFLRLNWEMNGDWYAFSAFDKSGNARAGNAHQHFRNAWRRAHILFQGGSRTEINSKLAALGLPGLTTEATSVPLTTNVSWVWTPNYDTKFPAKQTAFDYYPGDGFVDWVGVDWYGYGSGDAGTHANMADDPSGPNEIYERYSGPTSAGKKPFLLGEWGTFGQDRPLWIADMFDWIAQRPQVKAQIFFNVNASDEDSQLQSYPKSATAFRTGISGSEWIRDYRHVTTDTSSPQPAPPPSSETGPAPAPAPPPPAAAPAPVPAPAPPPAPADTTGPSLRLDSPASGQTVRGTFRVKPVVSDPSGVAKVTFYLDGVLQDTDVPPNVEWDFVTGSAPPGTRTIRIDATDTKGNVSSLSVPVVVAGSGPSISLTTPADGATVSGTLKVRPKVSDPSGIANVKFYLDGALKDTDVPTAIGWNLATTSIPTGKHVIRVDATNKRKQVSRLTRTIMVVRSSSTARAKSRIRVPSLSVALTARSGRLVATMKLARPTKAGTARRVAVYLDGRRVTVRKATGRTLRWSSKRLQPGRHVVRVVELNVLGRPVATSAAAGLIR